MSDQQFRTVVAAIVIIAILGGGVAYWQHSESAPPTSLRSAVSPTPSSSTSEPTSVLSVDIGRDGVLHNGSTEVDVAVSQESLQALADAAREQNTKRYYAVFDKHLAFRVADGTAVRVIGEGAYSGEVRIMSGTYTGKKGFVPQEWLVSK